VLGESDSDDTVIIPTVKHEGEVLESKEVSKKWWDHEEYVFTPRTISPLSRKLLLTQQ